MTEAEAEVTATLVARVRLRETCAQLQRSGAFIALADAFIAWLVARNDPAWLWPAVAWWCAALAAPMYRRRVAARYRTVEGAEVHAALRHMDHLSAFVGVIRASVVLLAFATGSEQTEFLLTLIVLGLASGATATSGGSYRSMLYWGVPVFGALAGCWALRGSWIDGVMAVLMLLLFRVLLGYMKALGTQQEKMIETAEELRIERDRVQSVNRSISLVVDQLREERDRAAAANETKTRFLASASHDLRQPLYALGLNSATLDDIAHELAHPQLTRVARGIRRSLEQSRYLLDSLLDMSKLEAHAVDVKWQVLELRRFLSPLLAEYEVQARDKGLAFGWPGEAPGEPWVRSDPALLERLLGNLLNNAVKFTTNGQVGVRVVCGEAAVGVEVFDSGPGIAPAERGRVFEEFYQIDNPARDRSRGLGLGLSIVRLLAPLLDARIELAEEPGGGCCFRVWLPHAAVPAPAQRPGPGLRTPAVVAPERHRVLVIDDEPDILDAVSTMLGQRGWDVVTARSSAQALQRIAGGAMPQVLLVDYRLGDENGIEAIAAVQKYAGSALPAVIVTGDTAPQRILQTTEAGFPVLHKPIDGDAVERLLGEALAASRSV